MSRTPRVRYPKRGAVALAALVVLASPGALAAPRFFGHYSGEAAVSTSPYYPPGTYAVDALIAQTESGIVGYVNIAYDPGDGLGGTITHTFSAPIAGASPLLTLKYSDRLCGAGDPIGKCYPHGPTQYSFQGSALFLGTQLTLSQPSILSSQYSSESTAATSIRSANASWNSGKAFSFSGIGLRISETGNGSPMSGTRESRQWRKPVGKRSTSTNRIDGTRTGHRSSHLHREGLRHSSGSPAVTSSGMSGNSPVGICAEGNTGRLVRLYLNRTATQPDV